MEAPAQGFNMVDIVDVMVERLVSVGMKEDAAEELAEEFLELAGESVETFIERRHRELQEEGYTSKEIYALVQEDLARWRFRAPPLSIRQIRRRIHG